MTEGICCCLVRNYRTSWPLKSIAEERVNDKEGVPRGMNKRSAGGLFGECQVSGAVRSILDMCKDFNYIINISSSILFTEKCREKMHANRMATNRPSKTGVWIRPNSGKLLLPAHVAFTDRRRAGLPFRNFSKYPLTVYTHKH